jgi:L-asparaginase II
MLALAKMLGAPKESYLEQAHPVQQLILTAFSEMVSVPRDEIILGIDGCSAPVFAVSLYHAALGFARLADPSALPEPRRSACRQIIAAMMHSPEMVSGYGTFDTCLMQAAGGSVFTKAGAEGFQGSGILPAGGQPASGIALKIAEGDIAGRFRQGAESTEGRARPLVTIEALRQLGALSPAQLAQLAPFDARTQHNWNHIDVGRLVPAFKLNSP